MSNLGVLSTIRPGRQRGSLDREYAQGYKQVNANAYTLGNKLDPLTVYRVVDGGRLLRQAGHSYDHLVLPHLDALFRAAMAICGSRQEAEDLTQTTLVRALERFETFKPGTNCRAWLYRIMRNLWTDQLRHMKVVGTSRPIDDEVMELEDEHPEELIWSNAEDLLENFSDEQVIKAMRQVPEDQRLSLFLTEVERFSYQEVAEITGVAMGTVKSRINRARALLTQKLQDYAKEMGFLETRT